MALEETDWVRAEAHFFALKKMYLEAGKTDRVNITPALLMTFNPLEARFRAGERTQELYDAMLAVE